MKILVTRTDRLGDLVLSLPVIDLIKRRRPDDSVHLLVSPQAVPLVENLPHLDRIWTWVPGDTCVRRDLLRGFRQEKFDASVMLQYHQELATLLKKAHIPRRYGPLSKLSSWFQLNRGTRQNRSRCRHHEMVYNLQLAEKLAGPGGGSALDVYQPRLPLSSRQLQQGQQFRESRAGGASQLVFIHPGSGGSALDWLPDRFAGVANSLASREGFKVFVTGSGQDARMIDPLREMLDPAVDVLLDAFDLRDFLGVLAAGDLFVGPSTGPLHMAAALGLAVVGLYPPVPTMGPGRWGPQGPWAKALVPEVDCPSDRYCQLGNCPRFNCLDAVAEREVLEAGLAMLDLRQDQIAAGIGRQNGG